MKHPLMAVSLALGLGGAQAITLDFGNGPAPPTICSSSPQGTGAMVVCGDSAFFNQDYGDVAGVVDVTYSQPLQSAAMTLRWWGSDYNDLYGVLWADGGDGPLSHARIELKPLGGGTVKLTHFDLGAWPHTTRGTIVDVYQIGSGVSLFHFDGNVGADPNHTSFNVDIASATGLWIDWRNSAFNVGIDNVVFAIPEPSTYALMLCGLAVVGSLVRRRRR